jgi:hypothetical protein
MRLKSDILVAIACGFAVAASLVSCGGGQLPGSSNDAGQTAGAAGAAGGAGASGGSLGGAGNGSGLGGTGESCLPGPPQECDLSLCGNGVRDMCMASAGLGFCPFVPQVERCDGTDLNGQTCQTLGYGSGALACSSICSLDTAGCSECLPLDASLLRCGDAPFSAAAVAAGLAATDSEVAIAWLELDASSRPMLGFARLTPNLELVGTSRLMNARGAPAIDPSVVKVRTTLLPSGWVVAGYYEREVFIHAVSAAGESVGRTTVDRFADGTLWAGPILASRPNGGPLIVVGDAGRDPGVGDRC